MYQFRIQFGVLQKPLAKPPEVEKICTSTHKHLLKNHI